MARKPTSTSYTKNDPRRVGGPGGPGARGQLRRDLTMVLVQKLNDAVADGNRPRMEKLVDNLIERACQVSEFA